MERRKVSREAEEKDATTKESTTHMHLRVKAAEGKRFFAGKLTNCPFCTTDRELLVKGLKERKP